MRKPCWSFISCCLLLLTACTSSHEEVTDFCAQHPSRLLTKPIVADGLFVELLFRELRDPYLFALAKVGEEGFLFVEMEGKEFGFATPYVRLERSSDSAVCERDNARLRAKMSHFDRIALPEQLRYLGAGTCLSLTDLAEPTARYRFERIDHSPPRPSKAYQELIGRTDLRFEYRLRDARSNTVLAESWSASHQTRTQWTGAESEWVGCDRHSEVSEMLKGITSVAGGSSIGPAGPEIARHENDAFQVAQHQPLALLETRLALTSEGSPLSNHDAVLTELKLRERTVEGVRVIWNDNRHYLEIERPANTLQCLLPWTDRQRRGRYDEPVPVRGDDHTIGLLSVQQKTPQPLSVEFLAYAPDCTPQLRLTAPLPLAPSAGRIYVSSIEWRANQLRFSLVQFARQESNQTGKAASPVLSLYQWGTPGHTEVPRAK